MTFRLSFNTPEKIIFEGEVISVIAPGSQGYLEILSHHAPLITSLQPGKVTITFSDQQKKIYAVSEGFLEVAKNNAILLVDAAELGTEIDPEQARRAVEKAEKNLQSESPDIDQTRAKKALARAKNRLKVYEDTVKSSEHQI